MIFATPFKKQERERDRDRETETETKVNLCWGVGGNKSSKQNSTHLNSKVFLLAVSDVGDEEDSFGVHGRKVLNINLFRLTTGHRHRHAWACVHSSVLEVTEKASCMPYWAQNGNNYSLDRFFPPAF